jgi:hypothetical protein
VTPTAGVFRFLPLPKREVPMPDRSDPLDTTEETARRLHRAPQTLARWRCEGSGPAYIKVGNRVLYPRPDVDAWIAGRRVMPPGRRPTAT